MGSTFDNIELPKNDNKSTNQIDDVDQMSLIEQVKERYEQDTHYRSDLAKWMMAVVTIWLLIVASVVIIQLFKGNGLSNVVLCTLLTTATINVLGLAGVILRGLFYFDPGKKRT